MNRVTTIVAATAALAGTAFGGPVTINVYPAAAPNAFGSPNWNAWVGNALHAIENNLSTFGTPGTPAYYQRITSPIDPRENFVTSYPSWRGYANPGVVWGPAFASELGNRVHFGLHILGNGTQFSISQLSLVMASTDTGNTLGYTFGLGAYQYDNGYVGINYGPDGLKGTFDDVIITSGPNTQLIDELIGRGSGIAWWPGGGDPDPANPLLGQQGAIEAARNNLGQSLPFDFTGTYTLHLPGGDVIGSGTVHFIPSPSSLALLAAAGMIASRRRQARPSA